MCAQIIEGICNKRTQKYFFETPNLNLNAVIQKATADEQAEKGVAHFQTNGNSSAMVAIKPTLKIRADVPASSALSVFVIALV
mgnify:CR=1 FL=1